MKTVAILAAICAILVGSSGHPGVQIIDGEDVQRKEFPYQVRITGLSDWNHTICTGALVVSEGNQFVLTSAYCAGFLHYGDFKGNKLFVGELRHDERSDDVQVRLPNRVIFPDDYEFTNRTGNIAIIGYEHPFELTDSVQPIELPRQDQTTVGDLLFCGWGDVTGTEQGKTEILQKTTLSVISGEECADEYHGYPDYNFVVSASMCAKASSGRNSHCHSDLGGPAKAQNGGYLAGIAAWPESCQQDGDVPQNMPEVYTSVAHYSDWIKLRARDL